MHKETQPSSRMLWADILKFWGIFAIVWGHTLNGGVVHQYLYSFHVPLFFFVIGLYFKPPRISFGCFCKRKAHSFLLPYFAFAIISVVIFMFLGEVGSSVLDADVTDFSLLTNVGKIFIGQCRANRPLWLLPCMFVFYILCFAFSKLTMKCSDCVCTVICILAIIGSVALCTLNSVVFNIKALFWKIDVAVFMIYFFLIAIMAKRFLVQSSYNVSSTLLGISFLLLGGIFAFQNSTVNYLSNSYGNILLFYVSSICTILGLCFISRVVSYINILALNKALTYVGQRTLPILLMHKFPILFFQVLFPWTRQPLKNNNPYVSLIVAIVSIVGCLIVYQIWKKIFYAIISKTR